MSIPLLVWIAVTPYVAAFSVLPLRKSPSTLTSASIRRLSSLDEPTHDAAAQEWLEQSEKFTILTCSATTCAAKRKSMNIDEFATYSAFYSRIQDSTEFSNVGLQETSCLGSCQFGPCVGIEHDDYDGPVALEGMNPDEFAKRTFHSVFSDDDTDRIWTSVGYAIRAMTEEEDERDEDLRNDTTGVEV